jgi:glycosyltransferase involved in cell wall biosynthesis
MKILYLHQYFNTPEMSGGTRSYEIAKRMVRNGHEVTMISSWKYKSDDFKKLQQVDGIKMIWIPVFYKNEMTPFRRMIAFIKFSILSSVYAFGVKSDLIYATSTPLTVAIPALLKKTFSNSVLVFEVRDLWPELPISVGVLKNPMIIFFAKFLEKITYLFSDLIIALSPGMKEGIIKCGINEKKIAVIPNSCDIDLFSKIKPTNNELLNEVIEDKTKLFITYAGAFGNINGVDYFVDLAKGLEEINSNVHILLIGHGANFAKIETLARNNGLLNKRIYIFPSVPKHSIPYVFHHSSMVASVFIDLKEMQNNSSNKFFDALAAGKPVFINFGGWMHELVIKNDFGYSAWGKSLQETCLDVTSLCNDDRVMYKKSKNSKLVARTFFERDVLVNQILHIINNGNYNLAYKIAPGKYKKLS